MSTADLFLARQQLKTLENIKSNTATGMISLMIRPDEQLSFIRKSLEIEYGTASNIKCRVNRQAVMDSITAVQQKLKLYSKPPKNGLAIFCGVIKTEDNKDKLIKVVLEPYKPIQQSFYQCGKTFETTALTQQLQNDDKYGFIIICGEGTLYGTVCGNSREILHSFIVDLPKKHGRGGQSALRFARLRLEKRHNYLRKVAELATQLFITDNRPNISGLIIGGSADLKNELNSSDLFDPRLKSIVIKIIDIAYGGESGFNQAINCSMEELKNVRYIHEIKVISTFFDQIAKNTGKYKLGIEETLKAAEMGAVETIIVWDKLPYNQLTLKNPQTDQLSIRYVNQTHRPDQFVDPITQCQLDIIEEILFVEWLAQNYQKFGAELEIISDVSQEGSQFSKGFGMGAILRYALPDSFEDEPENDTAYENEDDPF